MGESPVPTRVEVPIEWQAPAPEPSGEPVVSATDRRMDGERADEMSEGTEEAETYEVRDVDRPPRPRNVNALLRTIERLYPPALRDTQVEGRVYLRIRVDAQGMPGTIRITRSSDRRFDEVSIEAARPMRFHPARVDGRPVAVWVEIPISWTVQDRVPALAPFESRP